MYMWKYLYFMYVLDISIGLVWESKFMAASMRPCCQSWPPRPPAPAVLRRPGSNETGFHGTTVGGFIIPFGKESMRSYSGVSKNRGTQKWMVYNVKPY